MKPSSVIADLQAQIAARDAVIAAQNGALAAQGIETFAPTAPVLKALAPQESAFVGALFAHYPRVVGKWALLDKLPCRDHAVERDVKQLEVVAFRVRSKLGRDSVETVLGQGYRLGAGLHATLAGSGTTPNDFPQPD